jgi:hypothetical protein
LSRAKRTTNAVEGPPSGQQRRECVEAFSPRR